MNVLYDHQIFMLQKYGGISRYIYELVRRMPQLNELEIYLFMGFFLNQYGLQNHKEEFTKFFGHKLPEKVKRAYLLRSIDNQLLKRFSAKQNIDIYHQTYYYSLLPEFNGKRIVTAHDMIEELFPGDDPYFATMGEVKAKALAKADGIIAVSESTKKDLINLLHIPENKIKVIPLANALTVDVTGVPPVVDSPYLLYVGKRGGYKNFDLLLQAYGQSRQINQAYKLVCCGGGQFTTTEKEIMDKLGVGERVKVYHGDDLLLANLYKNATLFVFPSLYEGFGIPPLEAMHYGCPVLVSRTSSIPEVVQDAGVYFEPGNLEELKFKLEELLGDSSLRQRYSRMGQAHEQGFSWDKCAQMTRDYYEQIAGL